MSEDRTQSASPRRRQEARARGLVARSSELTAAVGLLAAVALLGIFGDQLGNGLISAVRSPFSSVSVAPDIDHVAGTIQSTLARVMFPLLAIVGGVVMAMLAAHQAQVGGFWSPGLIAPDLQRMWSAGGSGWVERGGRGVWSVVKAAVVAAVAAWLIHSRWDALAHLAQMDMPAMARGSAALLRSMLYTMGLATLVLGLADFWLQHRRVEELLKITPDEQREDQKAVDGDPAVRSRRQKMARSWRSDPGEILAGASLILTGPAGLTVILAGGPPPGRITVRSSAKGASGAILRRSAEKAGIRAVEAAAIARHFAQGAAKGAALPPELGAELARLWIS